MDIQWTYLLVNFGAIIIPLLFSFHPLLRFDKHWSAFFPACVLIAIGFIGWDVWFTNMGVWGFNPKYLSGIYWLNLPIEEWLFFFCIPYACVFSYHTLKVLILKDVMKKMYICNHLIYCNYTPHHRLFKPGKVVHFSDFYIDGNILVVTSLQI